MTGTLLLFDPARPNRPEYEYPESGEAPDEESGHPERIRHWIAGLRLSLTRPTTWAVLAAMAVGTAIRLDVPRGLWLDETISVSEARMPYGAMIHRLATTDVHPPFYFSVLWASVRLIGQGDFAVRVPSILFGILLIPLVFLLGKEAYDRRTGAVASIVVSVAPFVVWYSQEARMYSMLMVLSVLALWAQLRILRRGGLYPWVVYTAASAAMFGTQYFGIWQILTQQLIFLGMIIFRWRRHQRPGALLRPWLCSAALLLVALVPLGLMMKGQFSNAQSTGQAFQGASGAGLNIYSVMTDFGYAVTGFHSTPIMSHVISFWPLGMLAALVALGRHCKPVTYFFAVMVATPVAAMFVLGDLKSSLADVRYQSTIVPVLLVLIARAITSLATSKRALAITTVVVVALLGVGLFNQQFSSSNPRRYNFREALHRVDAQARPGDTILYDPTNSQLNDVTTYYSPHIKAVPLTPSPTVRSGHSIFIVTSSLLMTGPDRSILDRALGALDFRHKPYEHWVFPNVQVWVYK